MQRNFIHPPPGFDVKTGEDRSDPPLQSRQDRRKEWRGPGDRYPAPAENPGGAIPQFKAKSWVLGCYYLPACIRSAPLDQLPPEHYRIATTQDRGLLPFRRGWVPPAHTAGKGLWGLQVLWSPLWVPPTPSRRVVCGKFSACWGHPVGLGGHPYRPGRCFRSILRRTHPYRGSRRQRSRPPAMRSRPLRGCGPCRDHKLAAHTLHIVCDPPQTFIPCPQRQVITLNYEKRKKEQMPPSDK